ncbi:MAG: hypothetical protein Q4G67_00345 [Actinomycetia bacterium]|nr:hypothetical protein [Actinomycetes bacterium]
MAENRQREQLIETPEGPGRVRIHSPDTPAQGTVVLGHGAGGAGDSKDLAALARALPEAGWVVALVDQPWRVAGRKIATRPPRLDAAFVPMMTELFATPALPRPFVSAGRSAGARVACRTAAQVGADAVIAISFPLHPPGRPARSRYGELAAAGEHGLPVWVVQGERDPFGTPEELRAAGWSEAALRTVRGTHSPNPADTVAALTEILAELPVL